MSNIISTLKDKVTSIADYWNGDRNDVAMYDALLHTVDALDNIVDDIDELSVHNVLDDSWRYCDTYGLPECIGEFGGSGFSNNVIVTDGKNFWVDSVIYPHGIYGGDTTPRFCSTSHPVKEVIAWMHIPSLQK